MSRLRYYLIIIISVTILNFGFISLSQVTYSPILDSGYSTFNMAADLFINSNYDLPDSFTTDSNVVPSKEYEIIANWSDENNTNVYFVAMDEIYSSTYYYFANTDSDIYYSLDEYLLGILQENGLENVSLASNNMTELVFNHHDLILPLNSLENYYGYLYVESVDDSVLQLYDELIQAGIEIATDRNDILPSSILIQFLNLAQGNILGVVAFIGIIVQIILLVYLMITVARANKERLLVHRQFGLSRQRLALELSLESLALLFIVLLISVLIMLAIFSNDVSQVYFNKVFVFLLTLDVILILISCLIVLGYSLRGNTDE